jgi:hypothetical protein
LQTAIKSLDGLGMLRVKGFGLVPAAVAWQTETPTHTLVQEQADTRLSYGELLMAHALAAKSGQTFHQVVALRAQSPSWGKTAEQLQVDPDLLITKARLAATRIKLVDYRSRRRPEKDGGINLTSANPHTQRAVHQ